MLIYKNIQEASLQIDYKRNILLESCQSFSKLQTLQKDLEKENFVGDVYIQVNSKKTKRLETTIPLTSDGPLSGVLNGQIDLMQAKIIELTNQIVTDTLVLKDVIEHELGIIVIDDNKIK